MWFSLPINYTTSAEICQELCGISGDFFIGLSKKRGYSSFSFSRFFSKSAPYLIISENKIAAAACMLPLASDGNIARELGTRHRAAIGISKESDSIVVVVSEETGKISVAKDGTLIADVREDALKKILISNIVTKRLNEAKIRKEKRTIKQKVRNIFKKKEEAKKE